MKIDYYNSEDDYKKYINFVSYVFEKILSIVFIIFLFLNCVMTLFKIMTTFKFKLFFIGALLIIYLIAFLLFKFISKPLFNFINKIFVNRNLNKLLKNYPNMIGHKNIVIGEEKLMIYVNTDVMECDYSKLSVIVWRKDFIDIAYNKKILCVIPTNIFESGEEKEKFVKLLKHKTSKKQLYKK